MLGAVVIKARGVWGAPGGQVGGWVFVFVEWSGVEEEVREREERRGQGSGEVGEGEKGRRQAAFRCGGVVGACGVAVWGQRDAVAVAGCCCRLRVRGSDGGRMDCSRPLLYITSLAHFLMRYLWSFSSFVCPLP